ncbi:MAG: PD40 domain-containing protein [Phycisphaerae bacterium]|nr:PD40 domain-containing protein [Phycisphaerae bacterium]
MRRIAMIATMVAACSQVVPAWAAVTGYYRFPTIHGERVVFSCENDLWEVPATGGLATRLTTHDGTEAFPKFSPDGQWIAFSAEYDGNVDVYVMPADGGEPQRLTYHPDDDEVVSWRPDSQSVVFRSRRISTTRPQFLFEVPVGGGHPQQVPIGTAALASFSPDGRYVAFNRLSREFRNWKRYLGGTAQDVWIGDLGSSRFSKMTDWEGTDRFPMWDGERVCYLSDRAGRLNLFSSTPSGEDRQQLTEHADYDIRWPDLQGGRIVYLYGGDLWLLDLKTRATHKIEIELPSDRVRYRHHYADAGDTLEAYELDHDGERIVLSSRGEMWVRPVKAGRTIQLTRSSGIRERGPSFSPDGKHVAAITDETGEQELAIFDAAGRAPRRILTQRGKGWIFPPAWSPDGKWLAYADLTMALFIVDVESGAEKTVDQSEIWEIRQYVFSPDGKWLAYAKPVDDETGSIFLYDVERGTTHAVTTSFTDDHDPTWDPKGRYLYFLSDRTFNPILCDRDLEFIVTESSKPYAVILAKDGLSPFLPDELLPKDEDEAEDEEDDDEGGDDAAALPEMRVDIEGIEQRVVEFLVPPGNYTDLRAIEGRVFYMNGPTRGLREGQVYGDEWERNEELIAFDFETKKADVFIDKLDGYTLSGDGEHIAYGADDVIIVAPTDTPPGDAEEDDLDHINPSDLPLAVRPAEEWEQIFTEAWRLQRDFYWTENMAGIDWAAERERYAKLLPRISDRYELNDLIGQLIGELATSHTYVWGGDCVGADSVGVGLLGADLAPDAASNRQKITRVLRPETWETDVESPLSVSHANVQEGEYLLAINGQELTAADNVYERLANLAGEEVLLTVGSNADGSGSRDVQIKTIGSERELRYRDWCRRNREYVAEQTGGRVGYFHIPDMDGAGLLGFIKGFYPQLQREGLIIDVRSNGGGFVSEMIIERLARQCIAFDKTRRGRIGTYPYRVHRGHKVVITDENAGSDGDIFPEAFQILKLGPVIGMRSWGGVVGIRADKPFIDGGASSQPEFAWWEPRRGWNLENRGVEPDIEVLYRPEDHVAGRDPQLDRAIEEITRRMKEEPIEPPALTPVPDKSIGKMRKP